MAVGGYASTALLSSAISLAGAVWQVGVLRAGGWFTFGLRLPARKGAPGGRRAGHRFDGPVIVEPFNAGVRALPPPERVAAVAASLAAVWPG